MSDYQVALQNVASEHRFPLPEDHQVLLWTEQALRGRRDQAELTVRIVDAAEIQQLNASYRHMDKPTNVLSFPADLPPEIQIPLLGDVIICAAVVEREAQEQDKELNAHWAHMVIHGVLHPLGYDHIEENEAQEMEKLETDLITGLGYKDPYGKNQ